MARREVKDFAASERRVELLNGTVVYVPEGVPGTVKQWLPRSLGEPVARMPAERDADDTFFEAALLEHEIAEAEILQLDLQAIPTDDVAVIAPAVHARADERRVLLYRDESGGLTWHFPEQAPQLRAEDGGRETFVVPLRTAAARESLANRRLNLADRGILTSLGRKLFRILILPLAPAILSTPLHYFVRRWEERKRREILRTLTPDDYRNADVREVPDWRRMAEGRALLVVHGIFSSTYGMLSRLSKTQMEELYARYDGRVFAFDHFTVSKSPEENARDFVKWVRERTGGRELELDVLTHSRGGIVARTLREKADTTGVARIRRMFFVAPPNHGSALADADRIVDMIDVFTNLITDFPDGPIAYSIEILLAVLKCVAFAGIRDLGGIRDMQPGRSGYIERVLNASRIQGLSDYACVTANYDPDAQHDNGFFTGPFVNGVIDRVFGRGVENDLVVPTLGAFRKIGAQQQDIHSHTFPTGVWHTEFFANEETVRRALAHFEREQAAEFASEPEEWDTLESLGRSALEATTRRVDIAEVVRSVAAAEPAELEPVVLRRNPAISFYEDVVSGERMELKVMLDEPGVDMAAILRLVAGAGVEFLEIDVRLHAPGFEITPDAGKMTVRRNRIPEDEILFFWLTAHGVDEPTRREIMADFSIGTVSVGGVSHVTTVSPAGGTGHPQEEPPTPPVVDFSAVQREWPDVRIVVVALNAAPNDEAQPPFLIMMTSGMAKFPYPETPVGMFTPKTPDVATYLQTTLGPLLNAQPSPDDFPELGELVEALERWKAEMIRTLHSLGTELWDWLPDAFKTRYFEHVTRGARPRSIAIISQDMYYPWELVIPWRDKTDGTREELAPLGQAHILGRWRPSIETRPNPQHYELRRIALLHPEYEGGYQLAAAQEEGAALQTLFGDKAFRVHPSSTYGVRQQLLSASDVQLLHFCGHAQFNTANADQSMLMLSDDPGLTALELASSKLTSGKPVIVLNACSVGQPGEIASRVGGFTAKCLNRGCSAVLAAYWPISDRSAKEFSLALYAKLRAGHGIGAALQQLRVDHADNPTYQAYSYFGDPLARLLF